MQISRLINERIPMGSEIRRVRMVESILKEDSFAEGRGGGRSMGTGELLS